MRLENFSFCMASGIAKFVRHYNLSIQFALNLIGVVCVHGYKSNTARAIKLTKFIFHGKVYFTVTLINTLRF